MPLHARRVTIPDISVPITEDGDVTIRILAIPQGCAVDLIDELSRVATGHAPRAGTLAKIVLSGAHWEVHGPIVDDDGSQIEDADARRRIVERVVLSDFGLVNRLVDAVASYLALIPKNSPVASVSPEGPGPGQS